MRGRLHFLFVYAELLSFDNWQKHIHMYNHDNLNNNSNNTNTGGKNEFIRFYLQSLATRGERLNS